MNYSFRVLAHTLTRKDTKEGRVTSPAVREYTTRVPKGQKNCMVEKSQEKEKNKQIRMRASIARDATARHGESGLSEVALPYLGPTRRIAGFIL